MKGQPAFRTISDQSQQQATIEDLLEQPDSIFDCKEKNVN